MKAVRNTGIARIWGFGTLRKKKPGTIFESSEGIHRHDTGVYVEKKVSVTLKVKVTPWRACAGTEERRGYSSNIFETRH
jgi:hypothetical protein